PCSRMMGNPEASPHSSYPMLSTGVRANLTRDASVIAILCSHRCCPPPACLARPARVPDDGEGQVRHRLTANTVSDVGDTAVDVQHQMAIAVHGQACARMETLLYLGMKELLHPFELLRVHTNGGRIGKGGHVSPSHRMSEKSERHCSVGPVDMQLY